MRYVIDLHLTEDDYYGYEIDSAEYAIFLCHCISKFYPDYLGLSVWDTLEKKYIYYVDILSKKEGNSIV